MSPEDDRRTDEPDRRGSPQDQPQGGGQGGGRRGGGQGGGRRGGGQGGGRRGGGQGQPQGGQPQGGQGQPQGARGQGQPQGAQGQPGAGAAAQPVQQGPGMMAQIQQPAIFNEIKRVLGLFAMIGVGIGLVGAVVNVIADFATATLFAGAMLGAQIPIGVAVAVVYGERMAGWVQDNDPNVMGQPLYLGAGIGSGGGFLAMSLITTLLLVLTWPSQSVGGRTVSSSPDIAKILPLVILGAIIAGLVAAGAVYVDSMFSTGAARQGGAHEGARQGPR